MTLRAAQDCEQLSTEISRPVELAVCSGHFRITQSAVRSQGQTKAKVLFALADSGIKESYNKITCTKALNRKPCYKEGVDNK